MTRPRILTTANAIYLTIAAVLFLAFLFSQPITAAKAVMGITPTVAPSAVPPPTQAPPTSTLEPVATSTPAPPPPTARPQSPPKATAVPGEPTPTVVVVLPASGGGTGQSGVLFWIGGGAALFFGWLLHYRRQARKDAQT